MPGQGKSVRRGEDIWSVVIDISPVLPNAFEWLVLRLGDRWRNLIDGGAIGRQFFWYDIDVRWRSSDRIYVGLRESRGHLRHARSMVGATICSDLN